MTDKTQILLENEKIIYSIINKYTYYFDRDDLYQVGMLGLIDAYDNYNSNKNTKFSSFAYFYVLGKVKEYIRKSNVIKVSRELIKLNSSIEKAKEVLTQRLGYIPSNEEIALFLEIDIRNIEEAKEATNLVASLDSENEEEINLYNTLGYTEQAYNEEILDLKIELENLNDFERNLIIKRYGQGLTQTEVSKELGINQVKVSREEKQIVTRLRTRLK